MEGEFEEGGGKEFMEMTCVDRLNYNYYYLAFDVVRESNYKMLGWRGVRQGESPPRVIKSNLCYAVCFFFF